MRSGWFFAVLLFAPVAAHAFAQPTKFAPVAAHAFAQPTKSVDLARYTGRWHEIAHVFNRPQAGCVASAADYRLDAQGRLNVTQTCFSASGAAKTYRPRVQVLDPGTNAKLRLTFFYVFSREYWVLDHADDYSWAIVGEPSGRYLWMFARSPDLPQAEKSRLVARATSFGYDASRKIVYDQTEGAASGRACAPNQGGTR